MIVLAGTLKPTLIPWSIENDVPITTESPVYLKDLISKRCHD